MRSAFVETLCDLARDGRTWLLTGDLGYSVLEPFVQRFPERFVNVGAAEQNMIGIAAGLALSGKQVFVYSIANFPVMRCLEQTRNDVCYHGLDVKIVSVGGGLVYGSQGYSHHGVEDLAVMRAMPGMTVIAPADPVEAGLAVRAAAKMKGPCYLRLGKSGDPVVHRTQPSFEIGKAIRMRDGSDVTLVATGSMVKVAVEAADLLAASGIEARVLSMHTVQPIDAAALRDAAACTHLIATIEEHSATGGLRGAVLEALSAAPVPCIAFALPPDRLQVSGACGFMLERAGLSGPSVASAVATELGRRQGTRP